MSRTKQSKLTYPGRAPTRQGAQNGAVLRLFAWVQIGGAVRDRLNERNKSAQNRNRLCR